jgi:hypothetical protein
VKAIAKIIEGGDYALVFGESLDHEITIDARRGDSGDHVVGVRSQEQVRRRSGSRR